MPTKTRSGTGSTWAWLPVIATILLATLVPGIPEERGDGHADVHPDLHADVHADGHSDGDPDDDDDARPHRGPGRRPRRDDGRSGPGPPRLRKRPRHVLSYQLCLIAHATWTLGSPFGGVCTLSAPLTSPTIAFSGVPLGSAPGAGSYDLLLLGPASTVLAADDASAAPGLVVTGLANVPVGGRAGLLGFAFLIAAGAWVLLRQFR